MDIHRKDRLKSHAELSRLLDEWENEPGDFDARVYPMIEQAMQHWRDKTMLDTTDQLVEAWGHVGALLDAMLDADVIDELDVFLESAKAIDPAKTALLRRSLTDYAMRNAVIASKIKKGS